MTAEKYNERRIDATISALYALDAKFEHPYGDDASEILLDAISRLEQLREGDA